MANQRAKVDFIYLRGKVKYFRYNKPDTKYDPPRWQHVMYLDAPSLEQVRELQGQGVKNVLKKDDDGYFVTLSRHVYRDYRDRITGGIKRINFDPPEIRDSEMKPLNVLVGDGSDVTTKMEVYEHRTPGGGTAKAMRWNSSRIDNLIPYEDKRDQLPQEEQMTRGLAEQPPQTPDW